MAFLGRMGLLSGYRASIFFAIAIGCNGNTGTKESCSPGSERCSCYGNDTCDDGLACRSNVCVEDNRSIGGNAGENVGGNAGENAGGSRQSASIAGESSKRTGKTTTGGTALVNSGGTSTQTASGGIPSSKNGGSSSLSAIGGTAAATLGTSSSANGGTSTQNASGGMTSSKNGGTSSLSAIGGTAAATGGSSAAGGTGGTLNLGPNQISNGDFSLATSYWHVTDVHGDETNIPSVTDGAFCYNTINRLLSIGYPAEIAKSVYLQPGGTYAFTFRAMSTVATTMDFNVGYASAPYTSVFTNSTDIDSSWAEYRYTFVANITPSIAQSTPMGVAFTNRTINAGFQICIDDVVLALIFSP